MVIRWREQVGPGARAFNDATLAGVQHRISFPVDVVDAALVERDQAGLVLTAQHPHDGSLTAAGRAVFATRVPGALDVHLPAWSQPAVLTQFPCTRAVQHTAKTQIRTGVDANPRWSVGELSAEVATGLAKPLTDPDMRSA